MKKIMIAWLMILAVLLSFTACKSEEADIAAGGDTEINQPVAHTENNVTEEIDPTTETPDQADPTQTETPTDEEKKTEETQTPSEQESAQPEENKGSTNEEKTPTEEQTPAEDSTTDDDHSVSYYVTYQKVGQLQSPDGLESIALTYNRNQYAIIRVSNVDELQNFQNIADPYFQFSDAMEQGDQTGETEDSDSDSTPGEDGVVEDTDDPKTTGIDFVEGLTGNVYDSSFFNNNVLIFIYRVAPGKTNNGKITAAKIDGNQLNIYLDTTAQDSQTSDNVYRFINLEFKKSEVQGCEIFNLIEESK